jgi:hypothetical protein
MQGLGKLIAPIYWQFVPGGALTVDVDPNKDSSPIEREWRLSSGSRVRRLTDVINPIGTERLSYAINNRRRNDPVLINMHAELAYQRATYSR